MTNKYDFGENEYSARVRIKPKDLDWLKANKGKKSAAAFLEELLKYIQTSNQFKKHANKQKS